MNGFRFIAKITGYKGGKMPTGYTSGIADGISFEEFIMSCARAFGSLISLRDSNAAVPEKFEVDDYYKRSIKKAEEELAKLREMELYEAGDEADKEYYRKLDQREESIQKQISLKEKYDTMFLKVKEWQPPSPDHDELKNFMIEQINTSIEFDCNIDSDYYTGKIIKLTGERWLEREINSVLRNITYSKKRYSEECKRVNGRNLWLKQLRESLKETTK